jgi:hypothetical protein
MRTQVRNTGECRTDHWRGGDVGTAEIRVNVIGSHQDGSRPKELPSSGAIV